MSLLAKPAAEIHGYHHTEGGPSTRHAHGQIVIFFPRWCLLSFFIGGGVSFLASSKRSETNCAMHAARYRAHRSTGFTARFQPIDRGNRELSDHGKAQTLAGDWAVRARSSACLLRRPRAPSKASYTQMCRPSMCEGWHGMGVLLAATPNKRFQTLWGACYCRDPGNGRQLLENWCSSFVTGLVRPPARTPVRPSAVLAVLAEATGHVTDEGSRSTAHTQQCT